MPDVATIADAFPTLAGSGFAEVLARVGLTEADEVAALRNLAARQVVVDEAARLLIEFLPAVAISKSLPGATASPHEVISPTTFSVRPFNALRRAHRGRDRTWGELVKLSPADLFSFTNLGMKSAVEILATAAIRSLIALDDGALEADADDAFAAEAEVTSAVEPEVEVGGSDTNPTAATGWPAAGAWHVVAEWLQESTEAKTFGEGLEALRDRQLPAVVLAAWDEICSVEVEDVAPAPTTDYLDIFMARLSQSLGDERAQEIFWARIPPSAPTLEEVGTRFGVTRERVRQLQVKGEAQAVALVDGEFQRVRWRADALSSQLGAAFPTGSRWADATIASAGEGGDPSNSERLSSLLLWLAGPYRSYSDGWTRRGDLPSRGLVTSSVDQDGVLDEIRLKDELESFGLAPLASVEWISQHVATRSIDGVSYLWDGSVADKAAILLRAFGNPMTAEELTALIGEGHGERSTRGRLLEDERFKRIDRQRFGLREWPMDEYTGIADELTEEVERQGGSCEIGKLVAIVAQNYNLRPGSVEAYTGAPRFIVEDRVVRLRRSDEPYVSRRDITLEARCYVIDDGRCTYRMPIDREVLRGSGRSIPEGLGVWLGVLPGVRRVLSFGAIDIPVTWPDTALLGPSIGSLRRVVEGLGAELGNWMVLSFDRDRATGSAELIDNSELLTLKAEDQLSALTGIAWSPGEMETRVSFAVGATGGVGLRERLRQRGEDDLLALLPNHAAELDSALDRLKGVL